MRRITWYVGLVVGLLLLVAAPIIRWGVAPAVSVLPSDTDTLRVYSGTATTVINPSVARGTLFGPALLHNQPVTVQHRVTVTDTNGNNALVAERKAVSIPGTTIADVNHRYAVDRKTMGRGSGYAGVTIQTGQTFNWPIHTARHDYVGWVGDTQSTTTLHYAGTAKRGGVETYKFTTTVPAQRITDPAMLAALPPSITKSMVNAMVPSLGMTTSQLQKFAELLPTLPDPAPLGYLFSATSTYWVAPDSGIVVDVTSHEVRTAAFVVGSTLAPVGPVLDFTYSAPLLTIKGAAADATDSANKMQLVSTTLPLAALIAGGLVLAVVTVAGVRRRRHPAAPPAVAPEPRQLTPVG